MNRGEKERHGKARQPSECKPELGSGRAEEGDSFEKTKSTHVAWG